jgi:multiple antibiotic resistance protein
MNLPPNLLSAFVTVFVTIGPIETAVVFAALTAGVHRPERKSLAARSVTIAGVVLLLFALGGGALLSLLRVSLPAFRVAGGVLLFLQALTLTFSNPGLSSINASETRDAQHAGDIAIFPLAFPVIAGPGSLAAVVLVSRPNRLGNASNATRSCTRASPTAGASCERGEGASPIF